MLETTKSPLAQEYWEKGYVMLRGLFSKEEIAQCQIETDRLLQQDWVNPNNIRTPFRMGSNKAPERIDPIVDMSPLFQKIVSDERLLKVLRDILGDDALLFKDKLILKLPGVDGYTMHQDWAWGWQELCPSDEILSVSIQIDGADAANGCIELFPAYHQKLLTPDGLQTNFRPEEVAQIDLSTGEQMETQAGDILIFHSLAPHQSGRNNAAYSRRSLYLTYNSVRAGDLRNTYYERYKERVGSGEQFFR
jgi:hypothetical protein